MKANTEKRGSMQIKEVVHLFSATFIKTAAKLLEKRGNKKKYDVFFGNSYRKKKSYNCFKEVKSSTTFLFCVPPLFCMKVLLLLEIDFALLCMRGMPAVMNKYGRQHNG